MHLLVLHDLFIQWGTPSTDLFTAYKNKNRPRYCSRARIRLHSLDSALLLPWDMGLLYAFPSFPLLLKILLKIKRDRAHIILIAPTWPRQTWYPYLTQLVMCPPIHLPSGHSKPSHSGQVMYHTSQLGGPPPQSMAPTWFQHLESSHSKEVQEVLLHSKKSSTWHTYLQKWSIFQIWCTSLQSSPVSATLPHILTLKK